MAYHCHKYITRGNKVTITSWCPTRAVQSEILVEAWSGREPSAKQVKAFGCICYIHIPTKKRGKLDEKTEKGIFLGYSDQSKGYWVYNIRAKKLVISRDVEFDENVAWNWEEEKIKKRYVTLPDIPPTREESTSQEEGEVPDITTHGVTPPSSPRVTSEESTPESPILRLEDVLWWRRIMIWSFCSSPYTPLHE
ncbi:hypothetical protein NL676_011327 [Syzygium grande]|nr:hypothetical protein NL676_011327 [Syzygium grande]